MEAEVVTDWVAAGWEALGLAARDWVVAAVTVAAVLEVSDWVALVEVVKVVVVVGSVVVEWDEAEAAGLVAAETVVADWAVVETVELGWVEADLAPQCCTQSCLCTQLCPRTPDG